MNRSALLAVSLTFGLTFSLFRVPASSGTLQPATTLPPELYMPVISVGGGPSEVPAPQPSPLPISFVAPAPTVTPAPAAIGTPPPTASPTPAAIPTPPDAVMVGAGDIASCGSDGDEATGRILDRTPGTVFTLGDNVYNSGTASEFTRCYEPSWGQHKARTKPSAGNHDYATAGASGYYGYFGAAAGDPAKGYYSYDLGAWHILVVNSNCSQVGGCASGSAQEQWVRADLASRRTPCTLAYWHDPRFSSGRHGSAAQMQPIWQALYDAGAEIVLAGHDHLYERFAPQDARGLADPARGIRQFIVGSGGASHYSVGRRIANSEVVNTDTFGVLKLTLQPESYEWEFIPVEGKSFTDSGSGRCH